MWALLWALVVGVCRGEPLPSFSVCRLSRVLGSPRLCVAAGFSVEMIVSTGGVSPLAVGVRPSFERRCGRGAVRGFPGRWGFSAGGHEVSLWRGRWLDFAPRL